MTTFNISKNEKLVILAEFIKVIITTSVHEEVWYIIDDKFTPTYKDLWDPYTNKNQAQLITNKVMSNPLTKKYYEFLYDVFMYTDGKVKLETAMNMCVEIIGYVKQLQ